MEAGLRFFAVHQAPSCHIFSSVLPNHMGDCFRLDPNSSKHNRQKASLPSLRTFGQLLCHIGIIVVVPVAIFKRILNAMLSNVLIKVTAVMTLIYLGMPARLPRITKPSIGRCWRCDHFIPSDRDQQAYILQQIALSPVKEDIAQASKISTTTPAPFDKQF